MNSCNENNNISESLKRSQIFIMGSEKIQEVIQEVNQEGIQEEIKEEKSLKNNDKNINPVQKFEKVLITLQENFNKSSKNFLSPPEIKPENR